MSSVETTISGIPAPAWIMTTAMNCEAPGEHHERHEDGLGHRQTRLRGDDAVGEPERDHEVKAGMDPLRLKREFGKDLVLHGGINAVLWDQPELVCAEIDRLVPELKRDGGYVFSSDHSVPDSVSLERFRQITGLAKQLGRY